MRRTPTSSAKPKRSTSHKRTHPPPASKSVDEDDDLLVKALNERANSDRDVLVSKERYEDLKQAKKTLKLTTAQLASANKDLAELQLELKSQQSENQRLLKDVKGAQDMKKSESQGVKELTYANAQLTRQLDEARSSAQEQHRNHQAVLNKLRTSLSEIEKVVSSRGATAKRHLGKCQGTLVQIASALSKDLSKAQISRLLTEATQQLNQTLSVLTNNELSETTDETGGQMLELEQENAQLKEDVQRLRGNEDLLEQYRAAIDKMREQIQLLRERVKELEGGEDLKRQLEERDGRIALLSKEKEMLAEHVKTLQATLNEQRAVIENLRGIITKVGNGAEDRRVTTPKSEKRRTPSMTDFPKAAKMETRPVEDLDSRIERVYIGESNELNIQAEIASLDQEIYQLQSSLQRALDNP